MSPEEMKCPSTVKLNLSVSAAENQQPLHGTGYKSG